MAEDRTDVTEGILEKTSSKISVQECEEVVVLAANGLHLSKPTAAIKLYDFTKKQRFTQVESTFLQQIFQTWLRLFRTYVTLTLKTDTQLEQQAFTVKSYTDFISSIKEPVGIVYFSNGQTGDMGFWVFPINFVLNIIRKLLGGSGSEEMVPRPLTNIEKNLFLQFLSGCLEHFGQNIYPEAKLNNIKVLGLESNVHFVPKHSRPFESYLIQTVEWKVDDIIGNCSLAVPCTLIQPILDEFQAEREKLECNPNEKKMFWRNVYEKIDVPVTAEWRKNVTIKDIMYWREGTILDFPMNILSKTVLKANNTPKFVGSVGAASGHVVFNVERGYDECDE